MKKIIAFLIVIVLIVVLVLYFQDTKRVQLNELSKLAEYDESYEGDNNSIGLILKAAGINYVSYLLDRDERPFSVEIFYYPQSKEEKTEKEIVFFSSLVFALIQNVDEVSFIEQDQGEVLITITKEQIEMYYGFDISTLKDDKSELIDTIQLKIDEANELTNFGD